MKYRKMLELVRALRSGKYIQTTGALRDYYGDDKHKYAYCCLGVACVLAGKRFDKDHQVIHNGVKEGDVMTEDVITYFGFFSAAGSPSDCNGLAVGGNFYNKLAEANDKGRSFDEIAAAIRADWRRL